MRAIVLQDHGGPEVLRIAEIPDPVPGPEEVLVEVRAAGVNRADISQRQGTYPQPGPLPAHEIPGLEFAGVVAAAGPRVQRHRPGDRVCGLLVGGGYAEKVAVHERMAMRTPDRLSDEEAAAIPEVFLTAYDALLQQAALRAGESVLVHAIGSGVGTAALQLARDAGACVFGTARSEEKCRRALEMGAALGSLGRMVVLATVGGRHAEIDLGMLMHKRLRVMGSGLRARGIEEKVALTAAFERLALPGFAAGRLRPVVDRILPWTEAGEAHRALEAGEAFGKVVLRVG
jgi:NADPH2:quinone reductase